MKLRYDSNGATLIDFYFDRSLRARFRTLQPLCNRIFAIGTKSVCGFNIVAKSECSFEIWIRANTAITNLGRKWLSRSFAGKRHARTKPPP